MAIFGDQDTIKDAIIGITYNEINSTRECKLSRNLKNARQIIKCFIKFSDATVLAVILIPIQCHSTMPLDMLQCCSPNTLVPTRRYKMDVANRNRYHASAHETRHEFTHGCHHLNPSLAGTYLLLRPFYRGTLSIDSLWLYSRCDGRRPLSKL